MIKPIFYVNTHKGFAFIGNALRPVIVVGQTLKKVVDDAGIERMNTIELIVRTSPDSENVVISDSELFYSKDDYLKGEPVSKTQIQTWDFNLGNNWQYYTSENGRAVPHDFEFNRIDVRYERDKWLFSADTLPDKYYRTPEMCGVMAEFKYVDEDGKEQTHKGIMHRFLLTDKQKKLVEEVRKVWEKAEDAGVKFYYDIDRCSLGAFNSDNGNNDCRYMEDLTEDEKKELIPTEGYEMLELDFSPFYMGCDDVIYTKKG